jgi:hypothetical protein
MLVVCLFLAAIQAGADQDEGCPEPHPSHSLPTRQTQISILIAGLVALVADIGFDVVENLDGAGIRLNRATAAEVRALRTLASVRSTGRGISSILADGGDHFSLSVSTGHGRFNANLGRYFGQGDEDMMAVIPGH